MDINMAYYLPAEFGAINEDGDVGQINFGPKNTMFEIPEESVQHLKPLYILRDT
jgi:hypothetical protein